MHVVTPTYAKSNGSLQGRTRDIEHILLSLLVHNEVFPAGRHEGLLSLPMYNRVVLIKGLLSLLVCNGVAMQNALADYA